MSIMKPHPCFTHSEIWLSAIHGSKSNKLLRDVILRVSVS